MTIVSNRLEISNQINENGHLLYMYLILNRHTSVLHDLLFHMQSEYSQSLKIAQIDGFAVFLNNKYKFVEMNGESLSMQKITSVYGY